MKKLNRAFKIHRGAWQGRRFPYPPHLARPSHFTPAILKEAVFEILLNRIECHGCRISDYSFFDLCAGSGQMAWEAASLGFASVHLCEIDAKRLEHLGNIRKSILENLDNNSVRELAEHIHKERSDANQKIKLYHRDFRRMHKLIQDYSPSVIYLDMPYPFWKDEKMQFGLENFFLKLQQDPVRDSFSSWIFIQGPAFFETKRLQVSNTLEYRRYGKQHLSFWLQEESRQVQASQVSP